MAYDRVVEHLDTDGSTLIKDMSHRCTDAWFELLRKGGCGSAEVKLDYRFNERWTAANFSIGQYVRLSYSAGVVWYLGRIEAIDVTTPMGITLTLQGMMVEMAEVFPGGFGGVGDDVPHRYARTDWFPNDPDYSLQSWDIISQPNQLVELIWSQYIGPATNIGLGTVEAPSPATGLESLIFRGQESALAIIKQIATIANEASYGVDENGDLFFKKRVSTVVDTFQEGIDMESLTMTIDRSLMCNSLLITGDYIYEPVYGPGFYRYQGSWRNTASIAAYGEIRKEVFLPWIRTNEDALAFAKQFFAQYASPTLRHTFKTRPVSGLIKPWDGQVYLLDLPGTSSATQIFEKIKVNFNQDITFEITSGPEEFYIPAFKQDQRWEIPYQVMRFQPQPNPSA